MLDKIIHFSINNKFIIGLMTLFLIIWGVWSASKLPIDAVPDITNNQVQIITLCPTLAGQEVEQLVTFPIEQSIANLPDLEETRSISRFGLSVITVVFDDDVNIYFARQLISERLKEATSQIPEGIGTPELGPVSTGLGEVYQYILHPKKGSEKKYSAMDLRSMQDWIVARQLNGTPGIAEINSFGGKLKQYEVGVNPNRLKAMGVTIPDIFTALEKNNQNTGGAYIDKKPNAYFIRGVGLVTSLEDVKNIVVKSNPNSVPIFIKDVAEVKFGNAVRYGAMTYNGKVDAVGGVVMMLKGANSNEVVQRIKDKMIIIQKSLPDDVIVEPFIDRSKFVNRAISTVEKNLIEGALIVIFVLVLFLGNLRAGLIVASAIPLSMLFALGLMKIFGVSANLMSLGAIDFGLIVDGAVIIVEATLHHLGMRKSRQILTQQEMDNEVFVSASKIRSSAAFGEIIILIVYIPILTLVGIEGKMFSPMAQTVGFAIFGALILSLTYIPMMCALFLSKTASSKETLSDRMMKWLQKTYQPLLERAIKIKYRLIGITVGVFVFSLLLFSGMGGEFIPQLQEGDFAFEFKMPLETSLSQSIETSMQASRIVKQFDEVKIVVGKTGAGEVPTDPMPPGSTDLMIILKPQDEWKSGRTYDELGDAIEDKLRIIPGVFAEKSQPIQMKFNELMTGIKQDVAIKIFGENLDSLSVYAKKVENVIVNVKGVSTPQVEQVDGLPQINIEYDRLRIANYGLNVEDINSVVSTAFAGKSAGVVYENERKFDLVVRLDSTSRRSIDDVNNLLIPTPTGNQIPLSQVAKVDFKLGPAQISREAGKRRIVIGFNIQDRDVQSVVNEIQDKLATKVKLPSGYYFTYGGTFENLQKASNRLMIAVPISLLLIFMLLYFTFNSMKQASLIFSAIPMSAIGGVFALLIRGMPFSISAGIGFIALFGVAVLNGIVLIGTFNQLEKEGWDDVIKRVIEGTKIRLRPVLMTATVASLGFLPMALSHSAGAEVQKPLATVVIGGLITATFLTLFVLPLLYIIFNTKIKLKRKSITTLLIIGFLFSFNNGQAQSRKTIDEVLNLGLKDNLQYNINQSQISKNQFLIKGNKEFPKTGIFVENEDLRPSDKTGVWKIGLQQSFYMPQVNQAKKNYYQEQTKYYEFNREVINTELKKNIRSVYYQLWYLQDKAALYQRLDSIYVGLLKTTIVKVKTGESAGIEKISANVKLKEIETNIKQLQKEMLMQQQALMQLLNTSEAILPLSKSLEKLEYGLQSTSDNHPNLLLLQQNVAIANSEIAIQKSSRLPEFSGRFFSQKLYGVEDPYTGFSFSTSFPIFGSGANRNKIKAAKTEKEVQEQQLQYQTQILKSSLAQRQTEVEKSVSGLQFYETSGLHQAEEIIKAANQSYRAGEISYADFSLYLSQAIEIRKNYLDNLNAYNQAIIEYNYFTNK
ncbi:MAG: CusA/CzcA family heavy metal efflux RND transporter [Flavobacterium lindanitolerans]|uniref:CusA/CzcA family heavy metal efflux RND transporter n=1 Tax=Flavobacterium microcysteis TaxID=2596891 RepID=A0A501Q0T9_9FLAO|nr:MULTISPECIES: CusA/CzcA family heavy metal efflux RND transporter [Flavobacterium]MBL7869742.1 CusA/CzcA family heavy metal efflux RND transporter [Flavobacterium lindanitolerans]MDL2143527.1 CusA/CzcA family heavy metal efflux RND transporter [Flavobacterium tructae]TPD65922.1 CusA/CzcA family heavy metal efflux RND transporter [Flavobacterium microcysteis]